MNTDDTNLRQKKVFIFSGFASVTEFEKLELIHKIQSLGGFYYETESFKSSATHLIAYQPSLSQKFLGACAAGRWILLPNYINDSFQAEAWLPEKDYEWHKDNTEVNSGLPSCMYSAPRLCREKVASQKAGIFNSWRVAVLLQDKRRRTAYTRILELGDAQIIKCKLDAENFIEKYKNLTFLFIEKERKDATEILLTHDIPFVVPDYIRNFLLRDPPPSHQDFIISNYQPKVDYFIKFASHIFSGNTKHILKVQLKPLIQKLEFIKSLTNCEKNIYPNNGETGIKNVEAIENGASRNVTQELKLSCAIADSVKLPGLSRAVHEVARSKRIREKNMKSTSSNNPIRKKKSYRKSSNLPSSDPRSKITSSIFNCFQIEDKSRNHKYGSTINDSSEVPDVIKKKWKLHLQRRNCGLFPLPSYLTIEDKKSLDSSEVSSSFTSLIESCLDEKEYENAIDIADSFLSSEKYPQYQTLSDIAYKILQIAEEEKIATKAFSFLHKVLYLHPPLDLESRLYYIKALFPTSGGGSLWKHIVEMINSTKFSQGYTTNVPQLTKSKQLLLSFVITVLEQDFQLFLKSCLYPPTDIVRKDSRPLVVNVFWNRSEVGSANQNCHELFSLLAKSLSTYIETEFQKDILLCLQCLLTLVAECCQLSQKEQKVPEISPYMGPHCDKFALAFVLTCTGALNSIEKLQWFLTTLQPQWLKVKACLLLLEYYLTKWEFETGNDEIPLSLRKIVRQYMFTTPLIRRHNNATFQECEYMNNLETRKKFRIENEHTSEGKLLLDGKSSPETVPIDTACSSDVKNCMKCSAESAVKAYISAVKEENALTRLTYSASIRLLTSEEAHKYLLLVLNLLLSYLEMRNIHTLVKLLKQVVAEQKEVLQDEQTTAPENLQTIGKQSSANIVNSEKKDKNEQSIIYTLLERHLMFEPSLDTVLTVADDLYIAQEFHKHKTNFNEHLKTLCVENINLPKSILSAIQLITL